MLSIKKWWVWFRTGDTVLAHAVEIAAMEGKVPSLVEYRLEVTERIIKPGQDFLQLYNELAEKHEEALKWL